MHMSRFFLTSFGSLLFLTILLITTTISMFVFKQKLHSLKIELSNLDSIVAEEKKHAAMLEASRTLQHSPSYLKKIADKKLSARFTNVNQFVAFSDLRASNRRIVAN